MKEWEKHRDEMVQLYQVHKLGRVMEIMTQRHNFHAWYAKKQVLFKKHLALTIPFALFIHPQKSTARASHSLAGWGGSSL